MSFPDQLLEQAQHLANREKKRPRQASLRRAVSTAYYAFFHLPISEATKNWKRVGQRNALARVFGHGRMKDASERQRSELNAGFKKKPLPPTSEVTIARHLHEVVSAFIQSQQLRQTADYDNSR